MTEDSRDSGWEADLLSDDEETRIRAMHAACPCSGSVRLWEKYMSVLRQMKKDPSPAVRAIALHLEIDAVDHLMKDDEEASGWVRNRPGGNGRKGELRRVERRLT